MTKVIAAIDQGTTSTRCILFDHEGMIVSISQREHKQIFPKPGWVEHDPLEIWQNTKIVLEESVQKTALAVHDIAAIGVTNQRETAIIWNRRTGIPYYNAVVWQDTRTAEICKRLGGDFGQDRFRRKTGLPLATYFSGPKIIWLIDNVSGVREAALSGDLAFGNADTWVIWNLTGGVNGGLHITDVTNASRTMLMNLETLEWDDELLETFGIPKQILPEIVSSSDIYGETKEFI